jgi:solute carrier family 25 (mitochondrial carnitine/acylcarnitine transporter), member 20/29
MLRNFPGNAAYFSAFEYFRRRYARENNITDLSQVPAWVNFWAGGLGGLLYWLSVYPIDVIKSAIMTDALEPSKRKHAGYLAAARWLYGEAGVRAFFRGFGVCLMRAIPANGAIFLTVTELKRRKFPW